MRKLYERSVFIPDLHVPYHDEKAFACALAFVKVFKRHYGGMYTWAEIGCLCNLDSEYMEGQVADWQHGLGFGYFKRDNHRFILHVLPIVKGKLVFDGMEISG